MTRAEKAEHLLDMFEKGQIELLVSMNDVFGFACADAEEILFRDELEPALQLFREYGSDGLVAYATVRRGMTDPPANPAYHSQAFRDMMTRAKVLGVLTNDERKERMGIP